MSQLKKEDFEVVIGLEVHIQMDTNSKAFTRDHNEFGSEPNTNISAITLAHPGTLPKANKKHLEKAVLLALATGSTINKKNQFDRKNYFYPDLPKGYQITQDKHPICVGGSITFESGGEMKTVRLHHVHMEEDAGKSSHERSPRLSMVDYNRAGTPLLEMVTEPDLRSAEEVHDFIAHIQRMVKFLGVSDGNMEEGSLRADCNVSIRPKGQEEYGERCEIKNVNSKKFARQAVDYEFHRQFKMVSKGEEIHKQTMNFSPETGKTTPIRQKEDAHDYRYFPDPDLPPIVLSDDDIDSIKKKLPLLPEQYLIKLEEEYGLSEYDAGILIQEKEYVDYFIALAEGRKDYDNLAKLVINKVIPLANEKGVNPGEDFIASTRLFEFLEIIDSGKVPVSSAYQLLFPTMLGNPDQSLEQIATNLKIIKSDDQSFVDELVAKLIADHPAEYDKYKKGNKGLVGFFMGQAMRASQGKADPKVLKEKLMAALNG